jgi:hypothetical protein
MMGERVYKRDNGETFSIKELIRTEWAKANELHKLEGWKRMFSEDFDLLSFAEGFNAGMKHSIDISNGRIKLSTKEAEK